MKRILFASTAIAAFAGAASAEIAISGSAEMGIIGGDAVSFVSVTPIGTQFWNDVDVKFTMSGESDAGISFGAVVDLDEAGNLGAEENNQGTYVFISGAFGKLTLGDTDSAIDWALQETDIGTPGSIADNETGHPGFNDNYELSEIYNNSGLYDDQRLRYEYTSGAWGVAISYEQGATLPGGVVPDPVLADGTLSIGAKYALDLGGTTVNLGAGYATTDLVGGTEAFEVWGVSADASFAGGFSAVLNYAHFDMGSAFPGQDGPFIGVGVGYANGPWSVNVNYGKYTQNNTWENSGYGIAVGYDLGGGASVLFGYGSGEFGTGPRTEQSNWSFGLSMSF